MARGKSDNTLAVIILIILVLLLLGGGFTWLFGLSTPSGNTTEYWATSDFQPSAGQSFGESGTNYYTDMIAQKILAPTTFTVSEIQVHIGYRIGDPASLGTFSIGLASSINGSFIWKTSFNPNTVELWNGTVNLVYNFTVPSVTVHNATYVRLEYSGIGNNNDSIADALLMRTGTSRNQTDEGFWCHFTPLVPSYTESWHYGGNYVLSCGISGEASTTTQPQINVPDLLLLLVLIIIAIIILGELG